MSLPSDLNQWWESSLAFTAGGGGLIALTLYLRRVFRGLGLEDARIHAAEASATASEVILQNLQSEISRLSNRVAVLEGHVTHLNDKLADIRLVALECYELALKCNCDDETKALLLDRLRQIIKDA